ncbi:MAG: hypothetical protein DRP29_06025 [Thermodesulfobacteriota bacterium]|nr:MAG: hypothetical protein DRP29_06025 [Thermodesulfobacteriota bacterium]
MRYSLVIILSMHRFETTMLTKLLEQLGIFMGWRKEENNEALFFLKFNDWILRQANATWDNPYNYRLADEEFKNLMVKLAEKYIKSIRRIEYLGFIKGLKYKSLKELNFPWGWKDPRNTFTIDIWVKVFPNAKLIHIYRNPIDVAESLRRRATKMRKNFNWNWKKEIKFIFLKSHIGYGDSLRVMNIYEGIKLWKEYISKIFEAEKKYNLNIIHVKYEDLLEVPFENIKKILDKLGIHYNKNKIKQVVKNIDSQRKYAFLSNKELIKVYESIREDRMLFKLGYHQML